LAKKRDIFVDFLRGRLSAPGITNHNLLILFGPHKFLLWLRLCLSGQHGVLQKFRPMVSACLVFISLKGF